MYILVAYINYLDFECYNTLNWETATKFPSLDTFNLEILLALTDLQATPTDIEDTMRGQVQVDWNDLGSITQYAHSYILMKGPSCILEDFKSSLDAMGYVNVIELMIGNHWQGDQKPAASRSYSRKVESKGRAAHNRIIKMGRRSFELLDIFGEFGGFAILEVFHLDEITSMAANRFRDFAIFFTA